MEEKNNGLRMERGHSAGTERVKGEQKLAEETKSTPRPPETDGVSGCACGTINNNLARVRAQSHFEQSTNNLKMGRGKRARHWRAVVWPHMHIDAGSMGGGGPIPHVDELDPYKRDGPNNDFYDFKGRDDNSDGIIDTPTGYFSPDRFKIFHYVIIGHYKLDNHNSFGTADEPGDDICIWDRTIKDKNSYFAKHFMHELGHNLGLEHGNSNAYKSMRTGKYSYVDYNNDPSDGINGWQEIDLTLFVTSDIYD